MGKQNLEETILFHLSNQNISTIESTTTNVTSGNLTFVFVVPENDDFHSHSSIRLLKSKNDEVSDNVLRLNI